MKKRYVGGIVLAIVLYMAALSGAGAQTADPPSTIFEAQGLQCLVTSESVATSTCDMLILMRYNLPKNDWRAESGGEPLYMDTVDCVDDDEQNLLDPCQTSLLSGIVMQSFYSGPQGTGQLQGLRTLPRIGHGLSGLYLEAGHGLTFGDNTFETCIEVSSTVFSPATPVCANITWNEFTFEDASALDRTLYEHAQLVNASVAEEMASSLQAVIPGLQAIITSNQFISPFGTVMFREAYSRFPSATPDAFAVSRSNQSDVELSEVPTAAEVAISVEAAESLLFGYMEDWGVNHWGGASAQLVGGVVMIFIAVIAFTIIFMWLKSIFFGVAIAGLILFGGVLQFFVDWNMFMVGLLVLFTFGMFKFGREMFN